MMHKICPKLDVEIAWIICILFLVVRISPYECLSTGRDIGMLEVVQNANTIANIQKTYSSGFQSAFNKESLYRWLAEKNKERAQYVYS